MNYKILESNSVDIEVVDGGAFNNFTAGGKSGIIAEVFDECNLISQSNIVTISSGLLLLKGIRVKLLESADFSLSGNAGVDTTYYIVAKVILSNDGVVTFSLFLTTEQARTKENLYKNNSGVYELEIGRFIHSTDGSIKNLRRTAQIIKQNDGGTSSGLTEEEKEKVDKLVIDGTGDKFLADNGEYKEVSGGSGSSGVQDVQDTDGTSFVENGVATIPWAVENSGKHGLVLIGEKNYSGLTIDKSTGRLTLAGSTELVRKNPQSYKVAVLSTNLYSWIKYGIVQNNETLTAEEKANAQKWLGVEDLHTYSLGGFYTYSEDYGPMEDFALNIHCKGEAEINLRYVNIEGNLVYYIEADPNQIIGASAVPIGGMHPFGQVLLMGGLVYYADHDPIPGITNMIFMQEGAIYNNTITDMAKWAFDPSNGMWMDENGNETDKLPFYEI